MTYNNPVVPGFRPDPSVCRVGKDFYLVNSSFEYFPAIPIYHSTDLVSWEQIGHVVTRNSQLSLVKGAPNCLNIYAPTIRYNNGVFYCIVTNVTNDANGGNMIFTTTDINGEWSDPIKIPECQGIDPSLFFDDDEKVYYSGTGDNGVYVAQIDIKTGKLVSEIAYPWNGTGANNPEGPHIYKINGYYYLMLAEGGTELCHRVSIARSKAVFGPYEPCPFNPVLTNSCTWLPIKAVGHADVVDDENGNWWAVCLANRPISYPFRHSLGRETCLVPVVWENGWPLMGSNGHVLESVTVEKAAGEKTKVSGYVPGSDLSDSFNSDKLHPSWNYIYNPQGNLVCPSENGLILNGNSFGTSDDEPKAILCRRQEHISFICETELSVNPSAPDQEAGISLYMNNRHHYEAAVTQRSGKKCVLLRRQIGSLVAEENELSISAEKITLRIMADSNRIEFFVSQNGKDLASIGAGEAAYITTEVGGCFTGNMLALYSQNTQALFTQFTYKCNSCS